VLFIQLLFGHLVHMSHVTDRSRKCASESFDLGASLRVTPPHRSASKPSAAKVTASGLHDGSWPPETLSPGGFQRLNWSTLVVRQTKVGAFIH